jgi:hypothetical protein
LFCLLGLYVVAYFVSFLASPTGRFPSLDAAEHLTLAHQIATGTLPAEPFYRAMLYPGLLSLFLRLGVSPDGLPVVAGILGCLFHFASTLSVFQMANRAWNSARAGALASLLFGFNPVTIYFAAQPLDTSFALFLFVSGLNLLLLCYPKSRHDVRHLPVFAAAIGLWSLATLARPHYAIILAGLPFVLFASLWRTPKALVAALATAGLSVVVCLGSIGLWQKARCGEFRVMPTQGGYSLWVGNRPGANGRYYEQQVCLPPGTIENGENPARIESEFLYRQESGTTGPLNPERINHYWRSKTLAAIRAQPVAWLGLMARKTYYLFNNFEQYNNQTFAVQKQLSSILRWNPLGWGITLILCCAGLTMAVLSGRGCTGARPAALVAAFYGIGVIIFFVSDRFRLPLLPFLCIGAGAWGCASRNWGSAWRGRRAVLIGIVGCAATLATFSRAWGVHDLSPAVEDYVSLSIASGKADDDLDGLRWALRALEQRPDHPSALARAVTSFYNLKLQGADPEQEFPNESWQRQTDRVARIPQPTPGVRLVQAIALWKSGESTQANDILRSLADIRPSMNSDYARSDDALGVLILTGLETTDDEARAKSRVNDTKSFYLLAALARRENASARFIPETRRATIAQAQPLVAHIFP